MSYWGFRGGWGDFGGGYGGGYGDGVDRSGWSDKSAAALRRECQAKQLFKDFLEECKDKPHAAFPVTQEVVPCKVHLTNACWASFKRSVVAKGCKAKRREATVQERIASKDKRKSRMYVISITCPVNPRASIEGCSQGES